MNKTRFLRILLSLATVCFLSLSLVAQRHSEAFERWHRDKFSLFIHYGLYSELGGVWQGKPVKNGYSEQIYSFGIRDMKQYESVAKRFRPNRWNAEAIVALARKAGMKSIVFTSKHHDGFCMYRSAETPFNIVEATPSRRDVMKELSDACQRSGMKFGVYFSLIDWHFPEANPISDHNADRITPAHHQYNMRQVREILTGYGPVSELWFDMGSLTPKQSEELYCLVHELQPDCMVSGRLGNDRADFAVMGDNELPTEPIAIPWQTAASMFPETWGYRSWQERGSIRDKAREKFEDLVRVVCRGGNYLLNIGPEGNGSILPYESEVLRTMGEFLDMYGEGIYGTERSPFPELLPFGEVSVRDTMLYLFVRPDMAGKEVFIPVNGEFLEEVSNLTNASPLNMDIRKTGVRIRMPASMPESFLVLALAFNRNDFVLADRPQSYPLHTANSSRIYGHSCWDYYTGFKSITGMKWQAVSAPRAIIYTDMEAGKTLRLSVGKEEREITLEGGKSEEVSISHDGLSWGKPYVRQVGGVFGMIPDNILRGDSIPLPLPKGWEEMPVGQVEKKPWGEISSCLLVQDIVSDREQTVACHLTFGNGIYVTLNGKQITAELIRETGLAHELTVCLPLQKGKNRLAVKFMNRFGEELIRGVSWPKSYTRYLLPFEEFSLEKAGKKGISIELRPASVRYQGTSASIPNLALLDTIVP
ncbi:alpha-L-fucosidase [Porphyromonas gingivalis]|uniref:alpha-L-fucosidase n=1 Tax=Porphyromonas gingivalis TaxID=837 RepID=UPI000B4CD4FF|nr:alpha-L-fucosidase [Porphyromonas gingivalis]OWP32218.1 alpha-L-fucosidase [Porphyromonas gingivalis]